MGDTIWQTIWGWFGMFMVVFAPMLALTMAGMGLGMPDALAGAIGVVGWLAILCWLAEEGKRGTKIGRRANAIARFFGSDYD